MPLKILIVGGGIGGLAAAGFLRAKHSVTVLERGQIELDRDDYAISVVVNAFGLLQKAGLKFADLDNVVMTHIWQKDSNNKELNTIHFDTRLKRRAPSILTRRCKILAELLRFATGPEFSGPPAEIIRGAKVSRIDAAAGRVWTEDGREFEGDVVVGSDGIGSVCRSAVYDGEDVPSPNWRNFMIYMTTVPLEIIRAEADLDFLHNPESQGGFVTYSSANPTANPAKRILVLHVSPRECQVFGWTEEGELREQFDSKKTTILRDVDSSRVVNDFAGDFQEGLVGLFKKGGPVDAWRIRDLPSIHKWFLGKTVLIGDAVHAVTPHAGQGCNITIEDAEALAYLLRDTEPSDDLGPIFEKFVSLRKDRTHFVQRRSREMAGFLTEEDKKLEPIGPQAFPRVLHSYQGAESALASAGQRPPQAESK